MVSSTGNPTEHLIQSKTTIVAGSSRHLYQGHRSRSFIVDDVDELTEWRARQRTFDGAYLRTALGCSFYALTIVKIFHREFAKRLLILLISWMRRPRLNHDFADKNFPQTVTAVDASRIWGRDFQTPGDMVLLMGVALAALQLGILVVLFNFD